MLEFRETYSVLFSTNIMHLVLNKIKWQREIRKGLHIKVFRFLDNESSLMDDVLIFKTLPVGVFAKAAVEELKI